MAKHPWYKYTGLGLASMAATGAGGWVVKRFWVRGGFDKYEPGRVFPPGSAEAKALFRAAAKKVGLPEAWGDSEALHNILRKESGGKTGIPNYLYASMIERLKSQGMSESQAWGKVIDGVKKGLYESDTIKSGPEAGKKSSAVGLGQLTIPNQKAYMPRGSEGLGIPIEEAAGMLKYIQSHYGTPENAWSKYGRSGEGY